MVAKKIEYNIVVDTREQKPYWKNNIIKKKLDTGDYSLEGYETIIAYERKSAVDLRSSLIQGHARFSKELERARDLEHFAIIIDCDQQKFLANNFDGAKHSKVPPSQVFKILCTLNIKYGVEFYFTGGRYASKKLLTELFEAFLRQKA